MNLGIDCLALPANFSGAAYYILNLVKSLLQLPRSFKIQIYCKSHHSYLFKKFLQEKDELFEFELKNRVHQLFFYEQHLSKKLVNSNTDIFLATHYITPKADHSYKIISIFHDMGFLLYPEYYPFAKKIYFRNMIPRFVARSNRIVTVSKTTLSDLIKNIPGSKSKSLFIYPGTDHNFNPNVKSDAEIINKPFILAVNSFEKRKNIPFIIEIFNQLKNKHHIKHSLLLVGTVNNYLKKVKNIAERSPFKESIFILPEISSASLKEFYTKADMFINVSLYEGFGFTPFEAISRNCPAFLYSNSVLQELIGKSPYLIASSSVDVWVDKIYSAMKQGYSDKIEANKLKHLTWNNCAVKFRTLIENTMEN